MLDPLGKFVNNAYYSWEYLLKISQQHYAYNNTVSDSDNLVLMLYSLIDLVNAVMLARV